MGSKSQSHNAVSAYFTSKQILSFDFAAQSYTAVIVTVRAFTMFTVIRV